MRLRPPHGSWVAAAWILLAACAIETTPSGPPGEPDRDRETVVPNRGESNDLGSGGPSRPEVGADWVPPDAGSPPSAAAPVAPSSPTSRDGATTPPTDASSPPPTPTPDCDGDKDGIQGPQCGGPDCCDRDPEVRPGQTAFYDRPHACGGWDYNCDGQGTREFGTTACLSGADGQPCGIDGFREPTECGKAGTFLHCEWRVVCIAFSSSAVARCH